MKTARRLLTILFGLCLPVWLHASPVAYIPHQNGVSIVDVSFRGVIAEIPGNGGLGVAVKPEIGRAYATDLDNIFVIDTRPQALIAKVPLPALPRGPLLLHPTRPEIYLVTDGCARGAGACPAVISSVIRVFNTDTNTLVDSFDSQLDESRIAFTPNGLTLLVAESTQGTLRILHAGTRQPLGTVAIGGSALRGLVADPSNRFAYVIADGSTPAVVVVDLQTQTVVARVPVGASPQEMVLSGNRLYVTNAGSATMSVIDVAARTLLTNIAVGSTPMGIDVTPNGDQVIVANSGSASISVIDVPSLNVVTTIPVGTRPMALGRFTIGSSAPQLPDVLTGLWWNPAEPGWGVHVAHRGNRIFAAWFTYDASGQSKWYVSSDCVMNSQLPTPPATGEATCTGNIYDTTGPRFFSEPFNTGVVNVNKLGLFQMGFKDANNGAMSVVIGSTVKNMTLKRQVFAAGNIPGVDYTDLWWNPTESGWGIGITQQAGIMFLAWFAYDDSGTARWYIASNCTVNSTGNGCTGDVYRTSGPVDPLRNAFDPSKLQVTKVGTITASFADANTGRLDYVVDGKAGSKPITRQLF